MKKPKTTAEVFVDNLRMLLESTRMPRKELASKAHVSERYISMLLNGERTPTITVADDIGRAFGINGWDMLRQGLRYDLAKSGRLNQLIQEYSDSSKATQDYIDNVLDHENKIGGNGIH